VVESWVVVVVFAIMAPIDLNKNKDAIVKAHKEVSDPKSETNWQVLRVLTPTAVACPVCIDSALDFRIMASPFYDCYNTIILDT